MVDTCTSVAFLNCKLPVKPRQLSCHFQEDSGRDEAANILENTRV